MARTTFEVFDFPVNTREYEYNTESLLPGILLALKRRRLITDADELLLTGVAGEEGVLDRRSHGELYITHGVPLSDITSGQMWPENDPIKYADDFSGEAPTLMVYDLSQMHSAQDRKLWTRYRNQYGQIPDPVQYGVREGTLDDVTVAGILLEPTNLR